MAVTFDMVKGLLRHVLTTVGGVLATSGYIETSQVEGAVGALLIILGVAWSAIEKKAK